MKNNDKHIEDLFREKFSDYEIQPSGELWGKVTRKLSLREFLSFTPARFNVYYLLAVLFMIALSLLLILKKPEKNLDESNEPFSTGDFLKSDSTGPASGQDKVEPDNGVWKSGIKDQTLINETNSAVKKGNDTLSKTGENILSGEKPGDQSESETKDEDDRNKHKDHGEKPLNGEGTDETLISFMIYPKSGCAPLNVRLENYSRMEGKFEWHFGDGGNSDQRNPVYLFDEAGKYKISLSVFMKDGSVFSAVKTIEVFEKPKAAFEIYHESVLNREQPVVFLNYSNNALRYLWSFGDGSFSEEIFPEHYYKQAGNFDVKLKVWSENGCVDSTIVTNAFQSIIGKIEFPTAFIPNINGPSNGYYTQGLTTNEVFHPDYDRIAEYHLKIYSRSGILIFESKDINRGWDGYIKGRLAKQGVYVWKARGRFTNGQAFVKFGNVTLIKK